MKFRKVCVVSGYVTRQEGHRCYQCVGTYEKVRLWGAPITAGPTMGQKTLPS